tara:strand:- start:287 stop:577 length:291 start_codon:yes stop_codon:yes gene_type:complete
MFFGGNIPNAGKINSAMFKGFVTDSIAPVFDSFTLTTGEGFWKGESERSYILTMFVDELTDALKDDIEAVAQAYRTAYRQEAVMTNISRSDVILHV